MPGGAVINPPSVLACNMASSREIVVKMDDDAGCIVTPCIDELMCVVVCSSRWMHGDVTTRWLRHDTPELLVEDSIQNPRYSTTGRDERQYSRLSSPRIHKSSAFLYEENQADDHRVLRPVGICWYCAHLRAHCTFTHVWTAALRQSSTEFTSHSTKDRSISFKLCSEFTISDQS